MDASVNAPSATTGATAEEEDLAEDVGTTVAHARSGATGHVRTAGRISLARVPGGISIVRSILRAMLGFLRCRHHQEGMTTTIKTRGLGDFEEPRAIACILGRSSGPSLATYLQAFCS